MEKNEMEFSEMKQQMRMLQERLDKQVNINETQMRNAIAEKMTGLQRHDMRVLRICIIVTFVIPLMVYYGSGCSFGVSIFTFFFLAANTVWQYFLKFGGRDRLKDNLVETAEYLVKYKKNLKKAQLIGVPCALVWAVIYVNDLCKTIDDPEGIKFMIIGCVFGGIIGFIIGYRRFYLPSVHAADKILRQIDDLKTI